MSEILRGLYYGEMDFSSNLLKDDEEGQRLENVFELRQKELMDTLTDEGNEIYEAYGSAENDLEDRNREMAFQRGFKLAVHLLLEGNRL